MRVLILTEGYSHTGYGHISRCTAIAQVFRERNANVTFIVNGDESVKNLVQSYPLFVFNWLENTERLLEYLSQDDIIVRTRTGISLPEQKLLCHLPGEP